MKTMSFAERWTVLGRAGALVLVLALGLALGGCKTLSGGGADNTITTTIEHPDGTKETIEEKLSDDTAFVKGQVEAIEKQKPLFRMKAQAGQKITIDGMESMEVYAPRNSEIRQYVSAMERIFINGLPLIAMVAQGYINADMAVKLVNTVGALKADASSNIYNIATQDGGPVQITKGGNISNAAITVTKSTTTSTDDHSARP